MSLEGRIPRVIVGLAILALAGLPRPAEAIEWRKGFTICMQMIGIVPPDIAPDQLVEYKRSPEEVLGQGAPPVKLTRAIEHIKKMPALDWNFKVKRLDTLLFTIVKQGSGGWTYIRVPYQGPSRRQGEEVPSDQPQTSGTVFFGNADRMLLVTRDGRFYKASKVLAPDVEIWDLERKGMPTLGYMLNAVNKATWIAL